MARGLVEVEEVAAVVGGGGDDSQELHVGPEDAAEVQRDLVLDADLHVGDGRLLPLREPRLELDRPRLEHPDGDGDDCNVGDEGLPVADGDPRTLFAPFDLRHPERGNQECLKDHLSTRIWLN